jgi:membrane-associated phospholipid phosphatase
MIKVLLVLAWFLGIAAITGIAAVLARHASGIGPGAGQPAAGTVMRPRGHGARKPRAMPPHPGRSPGLHGPRARAARPESRRALAAAARFCLIVIVGAAAIFAVMVPLGLLATHGGPAIDKPFYHWTITHRSHLWMSVMKRATKIGNSQATWAAAGAAAVCLAVTWRTRRWLPPLALGSLFALNKLITHGIHHIVHRVGTPTAPLGTFPSGGSARSVAFYGLIAYLLWREFSGTRRGAIWATAAVAALGFNEGYSRGYLGLHWLTDILGGWVYGWLLLAVFIAAVRFAAGPVRPPAAGAPAAGAPAAGAPAAGQPAAPGAVPTERPPVAVPVPAAGHPSAGRPRAGHPPSVPPGRSRLPGIPHEQ